MATKQCPVCGKEFGNNKKASYTKVRTYCSRNCFNKRNPHECKTCGKTFYGGEVHAVYCSKRCHDNYGRKTLACLCCGKEFTVLRSSKRLYCSRKCATTIIAPNRRKREICICANCGKSFEAKIARKRQCCSMKCAAIKRGASNRGAQHYFYKPDATSSRGKNWQIQRLLTFARDGHCCQICHKKVGLKRHDYGVHHIQPYRIFKGDYLTANHLSNLITLCRACHSKVEHGVLPCPRPLI